VCIHKELFGNKSFIVKQSVSLVGRNLLYFNFPNRYKDVDVDQTPRIQVRVLQTPATHAVTAFNLNLSLNRKIENMKQIEYLLIILSML